MVDLMNNKNTIALTKKKELISRILFEASLIEDLVLKQKFLKYIIHQIIL